MIYIVFNGMSPGSSLDENYVDERGVDGPFAGDVDGQMAMESPAGSKSSRRVRFRQPPWPSHKRYVMSSINNVGGNSPINRIVTNPVQKQVPAGAPQQLNATDKLQLSGLSHLLKMAKDGDVRVDKVSQVKEAIASGKYEDDAKMDVAVDRLLDDLLK